MVLMGVTHIPWQHHSKQTTLGLEPVLPPEGAKSTLCSWEGAAGHWRGQYPPVPIKGGGIVATVTCTAAPSDFIQAGRLPMFTLQACAVWGTADI